MGYSAQDSADFVLDYKVTPAVHQQTIDNITQNHSDIGDIETTLGTDPEGSYADVAARLDALSSGGSFRNRLINGNFIIDQYSSGPFSGTLTAATEEYVIDRWYAEATGGTPAAAQVAGSGGRKYHFQFTGAASVSEIVFGQRIEAANIQDQASSTVTISVYLANSVLTTVNWAVTYADAEDDFSAVTAVDSGSWTVDSTMTRYTAEVALPANAANGIQLELSVGAQTSGTWTIGNVQLEPGDTVTDFEFREVSVERTLCKRYGYLIGAGNNVLTVAILYVHASTSVRAISIPIVEMRATPTLLSSSGTDYFNGFFSNTNHKFNSMTLLVSSTVNAVHLQGAATLSGLTPGLAGVLYTDDASSYLFAQSEL